MGLAGRVLDWIAPRQLPDEVGVAMAENEPQAQLMTQLLAHNGIPSNYQFVQGGSFWTAAPRGPWDPTGPCEMIVNLADATRAKELLREDGHPHYEQPRRPKRRRRKGV